METRKIQVTGKSTFIVSLPKKWANSVQITNGDSVIMMPMPDGTLLIDPRVSMKEKGLTRKTILVDTQDAEHLFRIFIGAYLAGYDLIEFRAMGTFDRETRSMIRRFAGKVIGPEVVEESNQAILVRDLLDASDFSLLKGIRRMHIIAKNMHENAVAISGRFDLDIAKEIESRDDEVDRLYWLIAKQHSLILRDPCFADRMGATPPEATDYLMVARSLERIADHAVKIVRFANNITHENHLIVKVDRVSTQVMALLDDAMKAFGQQKTEYAMDVLHRAKEIQARLNDLLEEAFALDEDPASIVSLSSIIDSVSRTASYTNDIAESAVDFQFAKMSSADMMSQNDKR